jgi:hypothetical protein
MPVSCFGRDAANADGLHRHCRDCLNAYRKQFFESSPERKHAASERKRRRRAEYWTTHSKKSKRINLVDKRFGKLVVTEPDGSRKWKCLCDCGTITSVFTANLTRWHTTSCGCALHFKLPEAGAAKNALYATYRSGAFHRGLEWNVGFEEFQGIVTGNCAYCGVEPHRPFRVKDKKHRGIFKYNGVDRIDNSKGYVTGNLVSCCKHCNISKNNLNYSDFKAWVARVYKHMFRRDKSAAQPKTQLLLVG